MTILDEVGADWDRLAEQSANVFATREWLTLWWERFGEGRRLIVDEVIDEGRVAAILALYAWRERPLRVLRFLGHGAGDELGPICAPADRPAAIGALGRLLERERWDVFVGEQLPGGDHWPDASVLAREGSPVIRAGGWEELLATRSGNFRYQVRSLERKLFERHDAAYRLADAATLETDLDALFRLHAARWGDRSALGLEQEAFLREFATVALARGWLRLWLLDVDGAPCAAWCGFRFANVEAYYQSGREPAWDGSSVGLVLLAHSIRAALADGVVEYRLLRGSEPYKYRFATADPGLQTVARPRGVLGTVVLGGARFVRRLRR